MIGRPRHRPRRDVCQPNGRPTRCCMSSNWRQLRGEPLRRRYPYVKNQCRIASWPSIGGSNSTCSRSHAMRAEEGGAIKSRGLPKGNIIQAGQHFPCRPILEVVRCGAQDFRRDPSPYKPIIFPPTKQPSNCCSSPVLIPKAFAVDMVYGQPSVKRGNRALADSAAPTLILKHGGVLRRRDPILCPHSPPVRRFPSGLRILMVCLTMLDCTRSI